MTRGLSRAVPAVVTALVLLGGCGDDGPSDYGAEHRNDFVEDCAADVATTLACQCFYDRMADSVPFERFEELDAGGSALDQLPGDIAGMAAGCAAADARVDGR